MLIWEKISGLLILAFEDTLFLVDETLYCQTDGVAVNSFPGLNFDNIFPHFEKKQFYYCPIEYKHWFNVGMLITFIIFCNDNQTPLFHENHNSKLANVSFNFDIESNGSLTFLHIFILIPHIDLPHLFYRKHDKTLFGLKFLSLSALLMKLQVSSLAYIEPIIIVLILSFPINLFP